MEKSPWSTGLSRIGQYYEGIVENVESTLELHRKDTVTTYGTRTSFKSTKSDDNKENDCNRNNCSNEKMVSIKREKMTYLVGSYQFIFCFMCLCRVLVTKSSQRYFGHARWEVNK